MSFGGTVSHLIIAISLLAGPENPTQHWAFQTVAQYPVPEVQDTSWPGCDIDRFVLSRLEEKKLAPASDAERATWLRRATIDLTGLPPTPDEYRTFVADTSPLAFEHCVDRLLESRRFGERWARHWLDLVSYADTVGVGRTVPTPYAWRYRDYVIRSFNQDKPFDQFVLEQLAGDLLPAENKAQKKEQIIATGFLAIGPWALVDGDKVQLRMDVVDSQISRIGQTFMAISIGCARCHDHKFDPVSQKEYYALAGILKSTMTLNRRMTEDYSAINHSRLPETPQELRSRADAAEEYAKQYGDELSTLKKSLRGSQEKRKQLQLEILELKQSSLENAADQRTALETELKELATEIGKSTQRARWIEYHWPAPPVAIAVEDMPQNEDCHINIGGNARELGELVSRGFPGAFSPKSQGSAAKHHLTRGESGRLDLARWMVNTRHPLTARVIVNRVWHHLFGTGLVRTTDNFGINGEAPSHPKLLDHLAHTLVEQKWSIKKLIRDIVLSRSYRMASSHNDAGIAVDPENRLLWRMPRRRLEAEVIRDSLLAVSGRLDPGRFGPCLPLKNASNVDFGLPESIHDNAQLDPEIRFRRTIYLPVKRKSAFNAVDILDVFDFPDTNECRGARAVTTVPNQTLYLLNSPFMEEETKAVAERLINEGRDGVARIRLLYELALGRPASSAEVDRGLVFVKEFQQKLGEVEEPPENPDLEVWARLAQAVLVSNEFLFRT